MNTPIENLSVHLQSAPFAALFLDALLKSFIVLALAGGVCVLWRGASAATRHLIWFSAVAILPFLPLLNSTWPHWHKSAWTVSTDGASGNLVSFAVELAPKSVTPPAHSLRAAPEVSTRAGIAAGSRKISTQFNARWILFGWLAWLAGAMVFMARSLAGQIGRRKFSAAAHLVQDAGWTRLLAEVCGTWRVRRPVTLLQSAESVMPMTWGWWRPVILLPSAAAQWPADRRQVVLLHELAHIKRCDYFTQVVAQLVCALYWFNPLVWIAARQMCIEREGACDDLVLAGGCKASEYAGHLVEIAGSFRSVPPVAAIAMARSSHLPGRIAAIVDASRNRRPHSAGALAILALIGGIALGLGGPGINGAGGADQARLLRQKQIVQLEAFSQQKERQSEMLAAASGESISPEFQKLFTAATNGDWQVVTNMYESFKQRHPQYSHSDGVGEPGLRTSYWSPALEVCLAYDHVVRCEPAYTQMAVDGIIHSIPAGSIYFGGTDPGRGLPTAFCKSHVDADPFYTLTQNALADGSYLDYLQCTYGTEKDVLGQMAEACRADAELQRIRTNSIPGREPLRSALADTQREIAEAQMDGDSERRASKVSELERKAKLQRDNASHFEEMLLQTRGERVKAILAGIQKSPRPADPATLYIPTADDSQRCFQDYCAGAMERLKNHQLKPGEVVVQDGAAFHVSGQAAVMQINGLLAKVIFDKNPGHDFFIEESFPLDWMYPNLEPHGLIMKINRQPLPEISEAMVGQDREFWQPRVDQMIGAWLNDGTPVVAVTSFGEKVFLRHDLAGFSGDPGFVQNDYASRMFSKFRSSIAGLYAWRAANSADASEKGRLTRAADFAFRQALALCPGSPEAAQRYMAFLKSQHREADAQLVQSMTDRFEAADLPAPAKASVFQLRLALDVPTDNTEPMRLVSGDGSTGAGEPLYVTKTVLLDQTAIQYAHLNQNPQGYEEIDVTFTGAGGKKFAEITKQYLHQRLAIVMDGKLWMAPVVQSEITGGKAEITGSFNAEEASALVAQINGAAGM